MDSDDGSKTAPRTSNDDKVLILILDPDRPSSSLLDSVSLRALTTKFYGRPNSMEPLGGLTDRYERYPSPT